MSSSVFSNKVKARHFHCTKRFIDNLCAINRRVPEYGVCDKIWALHTSAFFEALINLIDELGHISI